VTIISMIVPDELEQYSSYLQSFVDGMIMKLYKNRHKETPTVESLERIMDLLVTEITEFEEQVAQDKFDENSLIELCDQANFSFLAYVALRMQGVEHVTRIGLPIVGSEAMGNPPDDPNPIGS